MILLPSLETVVLLNPRTGSGSLYRAVMARWPNAIMLYRHMEANGVPDGYDRWRKVGIVRHPLDRLWSLYCYLGKVLRDEGKYQPHPTLKRGLAECHRVGFAHWVLTNTACFPVPYVDIVTGVIHPYFTVKHARAENQRSQFDFLRPDLGTEYFKYEEDGLNVLSAELMLLDKLPKENKSGCGATPTISDEVRQHLRRVCYWELADDSPVGYKL